MKIVKLAFLLVAAAALGGGLFAYNKIFSSNVCAGPGGVSIYVPHNVKSDYVLDRLSSSGAVRDQGSLLLVAKLKKFTDVPAKSGRYVLKDGMSSLDVIRLFMSGNQTPVRFTFNNIRTAPDLASAISRDLEIDSLSALSLVSGPASAGGDSCTAMCLFVPNTYQLYWNISPSDLLARMRGEYNKFWSSAKRQQALKRVGLSQLQVQILASIVEEETLKRDEQPKVAGLYINRLRKGMKLESDPTVKFAVGDFSLRRILNVHLQKDSPYNTYMYAGLPPLPIRIAMPSTVDAVLNFSKHDYLYMCAKEDFSGYHNFAVTAAQHQANARRYHDALNQRKIFR